MRTLCSKVGMDYTALLEPQEDGTVSQEGIEVSCASASCFVLP